MSRTLMRMLMSVSLLFVSSYSYAERTSGIFYAYALLGKLNIDKHHSDDMRVLGVTLGRTITPYMSVEAELLKSVGGGEYQSNDASVGSGEYQILTLGAYLAGRYGFRSNFMRLKGRIGVVHEEVENVRDEDPNLDSNATNLSGGIGVEMILLEDPLTRRSKAVGSFELTAIESSAIAYTFGLNLQF